MGRAAGHGLGWLGFFEEVAEPRQKAKVLYPLPELLVCCLVGVLCGAEGWVDVEEYGEAKLDFLRRFVPFDHGIASHDTFSDVFNALDPEGFKAAFIAWTATLQENVREIVAIKPGRARRTGQACFPPDPLLHHLDRPGCRRVRPRRAPALGDRERPPLGSRCRLPRGRVPHPKA